MKTDKPDLKKFINSESIYNYWQQTDYAPGGLEAAWLVFQSKKTTFSEQLCEGWNEIKKAINRKETITGGRMDGMNIEDFLNAIFSDYLPGFLNKFYEAEKDCVYAVNEYHCGRFHENEKNTLLFSSINDIKGFYKTATAPPSFYKITKKRLVNRPEPVGYSPQVFFNQDFQPVLTSRWTYCFEDEEIANKISAFNEMRFDFPVPFKKGDVIYVPALDRNDIEYETDPVVLSKKYDGSTDFIAFGQNSSGNVGSEYFKNIMDFEYYEGSYDGKRKIIRLFSDYSKRKIDAELFVKGFNVLMLREMTIRAIPWNYDDSELAFAGLIDPEDIGTDNSTEDAFEKMVSADEIDKMDRNASLNVILEGRLDQKTYTLDEFCDRFGVDLK